MRKLVFKYRKAIIIILVLCIYFTLLSLVSFVRASEGIVHIGKMICGAIITLLLLLLLGAEIISKGEIERKHAIMERQIERKKKGWNREQIVQWTVVLTTFVLGFILYYICGKQASDWYNSDGAFHIIAGKEIMSGNILLKDWYGARNTMYVLNVLYGLLGKVFGYSFDLSLLVPAFLWACFVAFVAVVLLHYYENRLPQCIMRVCFAFVLCFSSCFIWQWYGIFGGVHFDYILIGVFYSWVISKELESCKNCTFQLATASILLFFVIWSDNLMTVLIILPVLMGLIFNLFFCTNSKQRQFYTVKHLILTIFLFVSAKGSLAFLQNRGEMITTTPVNGVVVPEYSEVFTNVAYFVKSLLYLFSCDFWGQHIGLESWHLILRFLFLIVLFAGLFVSIKKLFRRTFNRFLLCFIVMEAFIIVFTDEGSFKDNGSSWTSRLLVCMFFSLVLLFSQIDWEQAISLIKLKISDKRWKALGAAAILLLLGLNVQSLRHLENKADVPSLEKLNPLASALVEQGLTQGFGTYWLSSGVTVASGFQTDVRPVMGSDLSSFQQWLTKKTDDWDYANFVIVDESEESDVIEERIIDSIGVPSKKISINDSAILVWDKNILPYINGSGYPGETMDAWWSMEAGQTEKEIEVNSRHFCSYFPVEEDGSFISDGAGQLIYGPYRSIEAGVYDIIFEYEYLGALEQGERIGFADINSNEGKAECTASPALAGENSVTVKNVRVFPECKDIELRFYADVEGVVVRKIIIARTEEI